MDFVAAAALGPSGMALSCCSSCLKKFPWRILILFLAIFFVASLLSFGYLEIQFSIGGWTNVTSSLIFGSVVAVFGSLSVYARCLYTLLVPSLFGKLGRKIVMAQVGWIIANVPIKNLLHNLRLESQTNSCLSQQLSNQLSVWKTKFQGVQDELRNNIVENLHLFSEIPRLINKQIKKIEDGLRSVMISLKELKVDCKELVKGLRKKCEETSSIAYGDCVDFVQNTMHLGFLKDICSIVDFESHVCKILTPGICIDISSTFGISGIFAHVKKSLVAFERLFNITITDYNSTSAHSNLHHSVEKMKAELSNQYDSLFNGMGYFFSVVNYIFILSFLLLVIENISYLNNVLDKKKDVPVNIFPFGNGKRKNHKSSKGWSFLNYVIITLGSFVFALVSTVSDWAVFLAMNASKVASTNITINTGTSVNSSLVISGGPILPPIANTFLSGIELKHEITLNLDINECMPIPLKPKTFNFWFHISVWYVVVLISIFCEKKLLVLKFRKIICFYYPALESTPHHSNMTDSSSSPSSSSSTDSDSTESENGHRSFSFGSKSKFNKTKSDKSKKSVLQIFQKKSKSSDTKADKTSEPGFISNFLDKKLENMAMKEKTRAFFRKKDDVVILLEDSDDDSEPEEQKSRFSFFQKYFGSSKSKPNSKTRFRGTTKESNSSSDSSSSSSSRSRSRSSSSRSSSSISNSSSDENTSESEVGYLTAEST